MAGGKQSRSACGFRMISYPRVRGMSFTSGCRSSCTKKHLTPSPKSSVRPSTPKNPGRRPIPPGRYFRMLLIGYFEDIDSERGRRCADSLSLREFLGLGPTESAPDRSSLCRYSSALAAGSAPRIVCLFAVFFQAGQTA